MIRFIRHALLGIASFLLIPSAADAYTVISTTLSTTASLSVTVAAGQQLIIQAADGNSESTTLTFTDSQGTPNTYVNRGKGVDGGFNFQLDWFDCLSPAPGTYTITLSGATGPQFVVRVVTGLSAFTGTFASADFGSTVPTTTDGVTTAAITPGSFPAAIMGAAFNNSGPGGVTLTAGTGFGNFFATTTSGHPQFIEDQTIASGSHIASFTAATGATHVIVVGAAYTETVVTAPSKFPFFGVGSLLRSPEPPVNDERMPSLAAEFRRRAA